MFCALSLYLVHWKAEVWKPHTFVQNTRMFVLHTASSLYFIHGCLGDVLWHCTISISICYSLSSYFSPVCVICNVTDFYLQVDIKWCQCMYFIFGCVGNVLWLCTISISICYSLSSHFLLVCVICNVTEVLHAVIACTSSLSVCVTSCVIALYPCLCYKLCHCTLPMSVLQAVSLHFTHVCVTSCVTEFYP